MIFGKSYLGFYPLIIREEYHSSFEILIGLQDLKYQAIPLLIIVLMLINASFKPPSKRE